MSKNVYCNVNMTAFDIIALSCGQQGSGSSSMTMHICSPHYLSQNFCQYIKSQSCCMRHTTQICHLSIFSYTHNWNEHWQAITMLTFKAIQTVVTKQLFSISWSAYQNCFQDLQKHWKWCTDAQRSYFKGYP